MIGGGAADGGVFTHKLQVCKPSSRVDTCSSQGLRDPGEVWLLGLRSSRLTGVVRARRGPDTTDP